MSIAMYLHQRRKTLYVALLLVLPLTWLVVIYLGALLALLANSFYRIDDFSGIILKEVGLQNFYALLDQSNIDVLLRTLGMSIAVTVTCALLGFVLAYYMAVYARRKALWYLAVMLPLWSSYLVRVYAWKLLLAKEGALSWSFEQIHAQWVLDGFLQLPWINATSLSFSSFGTYLVFVYMWLPFMVLPIYSALEKLPRTYWDAASDLGASAWQKLYTVTLPLVLPGVIAGSIFTFSLTLGDFIIPQIIGNSTLYIGQVIYRQQGVAGNLPFAAAFSFLPIIIIALYLWWAKRQGAFDAL